MALAASRGVGAVNDMMQTDPWSGEKGPLGYVANAIGLPAVQRTLERVAYGDRLTEGSGQTLRPKNDTTDTLTAGVGAVLAAPKALQAVGSGARAIASAEAGPMAGTRAAQRGIFGGFASKTADVDKLDRAQSLLADGRDMESIRQDTGWFKDPMDKKWKFEIDDSRSKNLLPGVYANKLKPYADNQQAYEDAMHLQDAAELNNGHHSAIDTNTVNQFRDTLGRDPHPAAPGIAQNNAPDELMRRYTAAEARHNDAKTQDFKLGDIFQHPDLYAAHPELKDITVRVTDTLPKNISGDMNARDKLLRINSVIADNPEVVRGVITHELEHATQSANSHGLGANAAGIRQQSEAVGRSMFDTANEYLAAQAVRDMAAKPGMNTESALAEVLKNAGQYGDEAKIRDSASYIRLLANSKQDLREVAKQQIVRARGHNPLSELEAFDAYLKSPGEVMARNAERRMNYTPAEREFVSPILQSQSVGKTSLAYPGSLDVNPADAKAFKPAYRLSTGKP